MSEFRVEKRRADAELTLSTGTRVKGAFFLAGSTSRHAGLERVGDLLNSGDGVFPFELAGGGTARTVLYNRAHITLVALPPIANEAQQEPGYAMATRRRVSILLSSGARVAGTVSVCRPAGRDRLSDHAHLEPAFWYLETSDHTLIINSAHIVELLEIGE